MAVHTPAIITMSIKLKRDKALCIEISCDHATYLNPLSPKQEPCKTAIKSLVSFPQLLSISANCGTAECQQQRYVRVIRGLRTKRRTSTIRAAIPGPLKTPISEKPSPEHRNPLLIHCSDLSLQALPYRITMQTKEKPNHAIPAAIALVGAMLIAFIIGSTAAEAPAEKR